MPEAFGRVQMDNRDAALLQLYEALKARNAPKPGSFSSLSIDERREYFRVARRRSRAREKTAAVAGRIEPNTQNIRDALADAALMILATGAPGAEEVRRVLAAIFEERPGVPLDVENRARRGRLKPKLAREV